MRNPDELRNLVRGVRWSPREWQRICALAARAGIRPSSYIRGAALREKYKPPKAPRTGRTRFAEPRGIERSIRFHEKEWGRVVHLAELAMLPPDRFVREAAVGYSINSRVNSNLIVQLIRIGTNLNQLTKLAHSLGQVDPTGRLEPMLERIERLFDELL